MQKVSGIARASGGGECEGRWGGDVVNSRLGFERMLPLR